MADVREERLRKRFDDCFVDLSFPQAPVTFFIILLFLESPAPTFGLVKATRLTAIYLVKHVSEVYSSGVRRLRTVVVSTR